MWFFGEDSKQADMEATVLLLNIFVEKFTRSSTLETRLFIQLAELQIRKLNGFMLHILKLTVRAGWQRRVAAAIERKKCANRCRTCGFVLLVTLASGLVGKRMSMLTKHITTQCISGSVNGLPCIRGASEHAFIQLLSRCFRAWLSHERLRASGSSL